MSEHSLPLTCAHNIRFLFYAGNQAYHEARCETDICVLDSDSRDMCRVSLLGANLSLTTLLLCVSVTQSATALLIQIMVCRCCKLYPLCIVPCWSIFYRPRYGVFDALCLGTMPVFPPAFIIAWSRCMDDDGNVCLPNGLLLLCWSGSVQPESLAVGMTAT